MAQPVFQIVATITARNFSLCAQLAQAGATAFRLNASHMDASGLRRAVDSIREALPGAPLVVDLQGAKMRLGRFTERAVSSGEVVRFAFEASGGAIPLPHAELFAAVKAGETLRCDDDRLRFSVKSVSAKELTATALGTGPLRPRKGVNVAEHPVELADLTAFDLGFIDALREVASISWAFSFMNDGREAAWLRRRLPGAYVIGKIERAEAIANLSAVDATVDAIWICRGDLGAQLGPSALARFVAGLKPGALKHPVLMAGQVLEHLTAHAEPTRSEVCHLYDLVERGYAGIVLSDETAVGSDPVNACTRAAALSRGHQAAIAG